MDASAKKRSFRAAVLLLDALFIALLGEGLLRVIPSHFRDAYERARYVSERTILQTDFCEPDPDPLVLWRNIPGKSGVFQNKEFRTAVSFNSLGMRGPEAPLDGDARPRVLVLGDSITLGWGVEEPETFVSLLGKAAPGMRFLNTAVSGYDTASEWGLLKRSGDRFKPREVLLVFYPNDPIEVSFRRPYQRSQPRPYVGLQRSYLAGFLREHNLHHLRQNEKLYYRGINRQMWALCSSYLSEMEHWCRRRGIPFRIAYAPLKDEIGEPFPVGYRRAVADFCAAEKLDFIDLTPAIQALPRPRDAYFKLDDHMTPLGHAAAARALKSRFRKR